MTKVIDFGPVDWAAIWRDRAAWVTPEHLKELNAITNATHLSHPGYWRNLFSSFSEVISNQGLIANQYQPKNSKIVPPKVFQMENKMTGVGDMNRFVQTTHENVVAEVSFQRAGVPYDPIAKGVTTVVVDTKAAVGKFIGDVDDFAKRAKEEAEKALQMVLIGALVIGGAYVYGQVK